MDGDPEFMRLFLAHQDGVRAFIRSLIRDPGTADDVFQETAIVLWQEFERYDPSRSFGAWARGIAGNKALKAYSRNKRYGLPLSPEVIESLSGAFDELEPVMQDERSALRLCCERLTDHSRRLLELRYGESLSLSDLARRVDRSEEAVHKALVRTRAALAKCIALRLRSAGETCP